MDAFYLSRTAHDRSTGDGGEADRVGADATQSGSDNGCLLSEPDCARPFNWRRRRS